MALVKPMGAEWRFVGPSKALLASEDWMDKAGKPERERTNCQASVRNLPWPIPLELEYLQPTSDSNCEERPTPGSATLKSLLDNQGTITSSFVSSDRYFHTFCWVA